VGLLCWTETVTAQNSQSYVRLGETREDSKGIRNEKFEEMYDGSQKCQVNSINCPGNSQILEVSSSCIMCVCVCECVCVLHRAIRNWNGPVYNSWNMPGNFVCVCVCVYVCVCVCVCVCGLRGQKGRVVKKKNKRHTSCYHLGKFYQVRLLASSHIILHNTNKKK
jgi:hypothetical protein